MGKGRCGGDLADAARSASEPVPAYGLDCQSGECMVRGDRARITLWRVSDQPATSGHSPRERLWIAYAPEQSPQAADLQQCSSNLHQVKQSRKLAKSVIDQFPGVLALQKGRHYWFDWRYICAMLIGYARVSTDDQDTAAHAAALKAASVLEKPGRDFAVGRRRFDRVSNDDADVRGLRCV